MSPDVPNFPSADASDKVLPHHRTDGRFHDDTLIPESDRYREHDFRRSQVPPLEPPAPPCCCPHPDRYRCAEMRGKPRRFDYIPYNADLDDYCDCSCHAPEYLWDREDD